MKHDPVLKSFSHVILDEIHARTMKSDFVIEARYSESKFNGIMLLLHNIYLFYYYVQCCYFIQFQIYICIAIVVICIFCICIFHKLYARVL